MPLDVLRKHLPGDVEDNADEVALASVEKAFEVATSGPNVDPKAFNRATNLLLIYTQLHRPLSTEQRATFVNRIWMEIKKPEVTLKSRAKWIAIISGLLEGKRHGLRKYLCIEWKEVLALIESVNFREDGELPLGSQSVEALHGSSFRDLVNQLRLFFPESSAPEIFEKFSNMMSDVHSVKILRAACLLRSFYPCFVRDSAKYVPVWMKQLQLVDHCGAWDSQFFSLFHRVDKYAEPPLDWSPYVAELFARIQSMLKLPRKGSSGASKFSRRFPSHLKTWSHASADAPRVAAKLAIMLLGHGPVSEDTGGLSLGTFLLGRLLSLTRTCYHPSNNGGHSGRLAKFLGTLSSSFVKRVGRERARVRHGSKNELPVNEKAYFIKQVLAIVDMALYSKNREMVSASSSSLRHFGWIAPQTIHDMFMPKIYAALDTTNLSSPHQTTAAMKAFMVLVQPFLQTRSILPQHLVNILNLTLPGLDPNDSIKTMMTLVMYQIVLFWVPLVDTSEFSGTAPEPVDVTMPSALHRLSEVTDGVPHERTGPSYDKSCMWYGIDEHLGRGLPEDHAINARNEMWSAGPGLAAWAHSALDRLLLLLDQASEKAKHGMAAHLDDTLFFTFEGMAVLMFSQMNPTLLRTSCEKLCKHVTENRSEHGTKEASALVAACSRADPKLTLQMLFPRIKDKVLENIGSSSWMSWSLALLGAAMRYAGKEILVYEKDTVEILKKAMWHKERSVRKAGGKLLRRMLRGLLERYVPKRNNFDQNEDWRKIAVSWGRMTTWESINVEWHVPSEEERACAVRIALPFLNFSISKLKSLGGIVCNATIDEKELGVTDLGSFSEKDQWRMHLRLLSQCVRGLLTLIRFGSPEAVKPITRIGEEDTDLDALGLSEVNRATLAELCKGLSDWLTANRPDNTTAMNGLVKLLTILGSTIGAGCISGKYGSRAMYMRYTVNNLRCRAFEKECAEEMTFRSVKDLPNSLDGAVPRYADDLVPRHMMLDTTQSFHQVRCEKAMFERGKSTRDFETNGKPKLTVGKYEQPYDSIICNLMDLSSHGFSSVRKLAQEGFTYVTQVFGWSLNRHLEGLLSTLSKPETPEKLTGSLYLILKPKPLIRITTSWKWFKEFVLHACEASKTIASLPTERQSSCLRRVLSTINYVLAHWHSLPILCQEDIQTRLDIMNNLVQFCNQGTTSISANTDHSPSPPHWRWQLMASVFLAVLLRDPKSPKNASMCSENDNAVPDSVWQWFLGACKSEVLPLRTAAAWVLYRLLLGYRRRRFEGDVSSATWKEAMKDKAFIQCVVETMAEDHNVATIAADGTEGGGRKQWSAGVGSLLKLARPSSNPWPCSRFSRSSASFSVGHVRMFEVMSDVCWTSDDIPTLTEILNGILFDNAENKSKARSCAAAELFAGVMSSANTKGGPEVDAIWKALSPLFGRIAQESSMETIPVWVDAVRYVVQDGISGTAYHIAKYILDTLSNNVASTESDEGVTKAAKSEFSYTANLFKLSNSILIESDFGSEAVENPSTMDLETIRKILVPLILQSFGHEYKAVRQEVGRSFVLLANAYASDISGIDSNGGVDWAHEVLDEVIQIVSKNAAEPGDDDKEKHSNRLLETILYCFLDWVLSSETARYSPYAVKFLPALFGAQGHANLDISRLATATLVDFAEGVRLFGYGGISGVQVLDVLKLVQKHGVKSKEWHKRKASLLFLSRFTVNHDAVISVLGNTQDNDDTSTLKMTEKLLRDSQAEVQEAACSLLSILITALDPEGSTLQELSDKYLKYSVTRIQKGKDDDSEEKKKKATKMMRRRLGGVLGLRSIVLAFPYDVPKILPDILVALSRNLSDPSPIDRMAKHALSEFQRTHRDTWSLHKAHFTVDQLDALDGLLVSPASYYS